MLCPILVGPGVLVMPGLLTLGIGGNDTVGDRRVVVIAVRGTMDGGRCTVTCRNVGPTAGLIRAGVLVGPYVPRVGSTRADGTDRGTIRAFAGTVCASFMPGSVLESMSALVLLIGVTIRAVSVLDRSAIRPLTIRAVSILGRLTVRAVLSSSGTACALTVPLLATLLRDCYNACGPLGDLIKGGTVLALLLVVLLPLVVIYVRGPNVLMVTVRSKLLGAYCPA